MAIRDKNFRYQVVTWEGLLQHIVQLASKGYTRIHVTYYPEEKRNKWIRIDEKIYRKYHSNLTRGQVDYRRKNGYKVYKFFRWKHIMILMSTSGKDHPEIDEDDKFLDLMTGQKKIQISERLFFVLYLDERKKITWKMGNETLDYWRRNIDYFLRLKQKHNVFQEVRKINYIPSYRGVYQQKQELKRVILDGIRKHGLKFSKDEKRKIFFDGNRYQIPVFKNEVCNAN